jgi:hypothetical protein
VESPEEAREIYEERRRDMDQLRDKAFKRYEKDWLQQKLMQD